MGSGGPGIDPDRLLEEIAKGTRSADAEELLHILNHVAQAGFSRQATEEVRSALAGTLWRGRTLRASDRIAPAERHYLKHVVLDQEWPLGTSLQDYLGSIADVILDATSGAFLNRYLGALSLGVARESRDLRGPGGNEWVLVQYRVSWGHWVTAFQPVKGLQELAAPQWSIVRWLRRPNSGDAF